MISSTRLRGFAFVILALVAVELLNFLLGPFGMAKEKTVPDFLFALILVLHVTWAVRLLRGSRERMLYGFFRTPEVLFFITLVFFLMSYIFASNANMDYVQRFAAMKGNLRLAPDSAIQRANSASRFGPLLVVQLAAIVFSRVRYPALSRRVIGTGGPASTWGLPLTMLSALLYTFAFPSFFSVVGYGPLAYIAAVPLLLVLYQSDYRWGLFYGVTFGVVETMLTNYWLGTFSLVSLQFITIVMFIELTIFMAIMLAVVKRLPSLAFLTVPLAWVAFDWLKSTGFLGYPWGMAGVTQYRFTPVIQVAALTGVWGVSFLVWLMNASIAHALARIHARGLASARKTFGPFAAAAGLLVVAIAGGAIAVRIQEHRAPDHTVRISLVQQNTDPRKNDYGQTFDTLKRLTDDAMAQHPDLVAWSETAFVPNIRKWSTYDPTKYPYAKLVDEFLAYQKSLGTWLLTGNDDYSESIDAAGNDVRKDYNASVLFSPDGRRIETYHKIHLVPFTEYFPYKKQLPFVYNVLMNFDVYLWEPGDRYVVFSTPKVSFSTPICFEDAFPDDVRRFVAAGAQVIMNISNDYWSLTPTEGQQHFMNSLFRAVENRRPLLRATASGVTGYVDSAGRLVARVPFYEPAVMTVAVPVYAARETIYTRYGDWFPKLCAILVLIVLFVGFSPRLPRRSL